ncbi:hypothetical protein I3760_15G133400 [Carya illinoinensis]|nr:hypothetical protein I3760_15G133400 [Carya illinoinensis]KAG2667848.1 hypothetical protein I3760_15G133400 [Carya illinoinensis]
MDQTEYQKIEKEEDFCSEEQQLGMTISEVASDTTSSPDNINKTTISSGHHVFLRRLAKATLLLFGGIVVFILILQNSSSPFGFLPTSSSFHLFSSTEKGSWVLNRVLKDAAMEDRTVILTTLNEAWIEPNSMFDLFLESFRIGNGTRRLLNHLVIICMDQKAYARCLALNFHCYHPDSKGVNYTGEALFMTKSYLEMMWARIDLFASILEMGYNFVFTDTDIMWLRDPFQHFYLEADFQIACDQFFGNSYDVNNNPNGGFNFVKSNNRTIQFYKFWYRSREAYPGKHDQDVLNMIKGDPFITNIGLKMRFLDTAYFGGFCEPSRDLNKVCTMHANCCVGLDKKVHDLRILLEDWKKYMSLLSNMTASPPSSWSVPQDCRTSFNHLPKNQTSGLGNR